MHVVRSIVVLLPALAALGSASPLAGGPKAVPRQKSWTVGQPVTVKAGVVRGAASRVRPEVSAYLGIPFGKPPTGQQRFMPPVAVTSFGNSTGNSTAFDASDFGPDCPSSHSKWLKRGRKGNFPSLLQPGVGDSLWANEQITNR